MDEIRPKDIETANRWSLVLYARGIGHEVRVAHHEITILVREEDLDVAWQEILAYEKENKEWPKTHSVEAQDFHEIEGPILTLLVLFSIFSLFLSDALRQMLISVGANEAHALFGEGEWWRPITALTLHQDPSHLLSNMVIGGLFLTLLSQAMGAGAAWTVTFLSGAIGNVLSILIRPGIGSSIGASTSVFGALGGLSGFHLAQAMREELSLKRPIVYLGTGLALLSFLGVGDKTTDRTAHLMGFLIGLSFGAVIGWNWEASLPIFRSYAPYIYLTIIGLIVVAWATGLWATGNLQNFIEGLGLIFGS